MLPQFTSRLTISAHCNSTNKQTEGCSPNIKCLAGSVMACTNTDRKTSTKFGTYQVWITSNGNGMSYMELGCHCVSSLFIIINVTIKPEYRAMTAKRTKVKCGERQLQQD
uniref:Uncharacterized protein n=1 Tax=Arion vulgaris TaxID=1028688 RepID=A0A0B6Z7T3_9EUPU